MLARVVPALIFFPFQFIYEQGRPIDTLCLCPFRKASAPWVVLANKALVISAVRRTSSF